MILPINVHFNGQAFSSVFEQFSFTSKFFLVKNAKIDFFKKTGFESSFYKIYFKVVANWSVRLEKKPQTIIFCLWWIFYAFLKCCIFQI